MSCSSTPWTPSTVAQCWRKPVWSIVPASKERLKHPQMHPSFTGDPPSRRYRCSSRERALERVKDLVKEDDVPSSLRRRCLGRQTAVDAFGEVHELLLERLLHGRGHPLLERPAVLHPLHDDLGGHVAEEGRREHEPHPIPPTEEHHGLLIVGEVREVMEADRGAHARGVTEARHQAAAFRPHVGEAYL